MRNLTTNVKTPISMKVERLPVSVGVMNSRFVATIFCRDVSPGCVSTGRGLIRGVTFVYIAYQGATIARQQKQIEALTAGLQKVNAQLELKKTGRQTVVTISKSRRR